jgi:hypothetical protein
MAAPSAPSTSDVTYSSGWVDPYPTSTKAPTSQASSASVTTDAPYTPEQTYLIFATSDKSAAPSITTPTGTTSEPSAITTLYQPSAATLPTGMPTIIVPYSSPTQTQGVTEKPTTPENGQSLIDIVLNGQTFPWQFVVTNTNATAQLFLMFPQMVANALNISCEHVVL